MATQLIRLTLLDGDPEGLRWASIAGRTTLVFGCPWSQLKALLGREEARRPGVYFLVGSPKLDAATVYEQAIYIGECDALADRFGSKHHKADDAEWSQIFLVTTSEGTFNKAHARQAEFLLRERAEEAKRALVLTKVAASGKLDEGDGAFAAEFVANAVLLAQTLGLTLFRAPARSEARSPDLLHLKGDLQVSEGPLPTFRFEYTNNPINAEMVLDGAEFVLKKGSLALSRDGEGLPLSVVAKRQAARETGLLAPTSDKKFEEFTSDYSTTSPSAAGAMIYGSSCAGPVAWRHVVTRQTYRDWLASQTGAENG